MTSNSLRFFSTVLALAATGCGGSFLTSADALDPWLREMGFPERASWESTRLHLDRTEIPGTSRISLLLDQVTDLAVVRPEGDDWGLVRTLEDGGRCDLSLMVNGTRLGRRRVGGNWTVDYVSTARDLVGLEVHFGSEGPVLVPDGCGVVLLWTRSRELVPDGPFRGGVVGTFWGVPPDEVAEVSLEPGGRLGSFDGRGEFAVVDVLPGAYHLVVRDSDGELGRVPVRVYANADTRIDVPLDERGGRDDAPRSWAGCYALRSVTWSRPLTDDEMALHEPPDTFRLYDVEGTEVWEKDRPVVRPRMPRPSWGGRPGAHWAPDGDSVEVVWTTGHTGALLVLRDGEGGLQARVRWISDALSGEWPTARAAVDPVACPGSLPDDPFSLDTRAR